MTGKNLHFGLFIHTFWYTMAWEHASLGHLQARQDQAAHHIRPRAQHGLWRHYLRLRPHVEPE